MVVVVGVGCGSTDAVDACAARAPGDLVFTELMIDPEGADLGQEWLEAASTLEQDLELAGLTLYRKATDGSGLKAVPLTAGVVAAHGYVVFGDLAAGPWVTSGAGAALGTLDNARGVVGLRCGEVVLDEVTWTRPAVPGRARMLDGVAAPGTFANDDERRWCDAPPDALYAGGNAGTPGARNPPCPGAGDPRERCLDGASSRPVVHPGPGDVFVTEVLASPAASGDAVGEWLEVAARTDLDLNGVTVANSTGAADTLESPRCLRVQAGERAVLARSADAFINGGLPAPLATYAVPLSSLNERVVLRLGDAGLDEAQVYASASGHAWQLDPLHLDAAGNDDPTHFCLARGHWRPDGGGDFGSPGAPNPPCATSTPSPATTCVDPGTGATRAIRPPARGEVALSEVMADPAAVADATGEYIELHLTQEADLNGLSLAVSSGPPSTVEAATCLSALAGAYPVFGRSRDDRLNGGLPALAGLFTFDLRNAGDRLELRALDGGVLDELTWTASTPGVSLQVSGARSCLTPDGGANHYGLGDRGTPGRPNVACP
jgi:hypothetical protein